MTDQMKPQQTEADQPDERRVLRALGNVCNGTISPREGRWLADQLGESPTLRDLYVDYMTMHACISSEVASLHPALAQPEAQLTKVRSQQTSKPRAAQFPNRAWLILAASILFVALFTSLYGKAWLAGGGQRAEREGVAEAALPIARITGTQNCLWGDHGTDIGYGSELRTGQTIQLREGLAEVTFEDGATMLLESPATVVFRATNKIEMLEGRLSAIVPPDSSDFSVHTRSLDVNNVDAQFGLLARETGAAELHVFTGTVEANFLNTAGEQRRQMAVHASEAVSASPTTTTVYEFAANETHFVRSMSQTPGPHAGLLAYEGFAYPVGPLSEQNGGFGWAGAWSTIAADRAAGHESNSVVARGLEVDGIVPRGNHAAIVAQRNRIRRSLSTSIGGVFDVVGLVEDQNGVRLVGQDNATIYLSFLQQVSKADDGFYAVELHRGDGNANRVLCIGNGADGTAFGVTSAVNVYGAKNFPSLGEENTNVNLFVVKISFGAGNRDTVEVYRNPASLDDEELCQADVVLRGNFAFDRISLANFDGTKVHEVDELSVGTHFSSVTGRYGGERGRFLRRLTDNVRPSTEFTKPNSNFATTYGSARSSRKLVMLDMLNRQPSSRL